MSERTVDAIVLGAGPAGEVCAGRLGEGGLDVVLVEEHLIGGECSYYACMPSKALLRPGELLAETQRVPGVAEACGGPIDAGAALKRRTEVIHGLDDSGHLPWLEERSVTPIRGAGRLDGERRVLVGDDAFTARRAIVIATGSGAAMPPVDGLASVETWNNRDATTAEEVPESLTVLGGGPVGAELAQAWSSLGTRVTLIEAADRLLPREEPFAGEQLAGALRDTYGVDVRVGAGMEHVRSEGGEIVATLAGGSEVGSAELLIAVGRKPRSEEIGLESVGIEPSGFLEVDDRLRVGGREWLYAVGDVNGRVLLTHMGKYQARLAADTILGRGEAAIAEPIGSPRVTFTDPQVAAVGKTEAEARDAGIDVYCVETATDGSAGASFYGRGTGGTSRIVVDATREVIVGATFVGFETAELVHAATIAVVAEVPLQRLRHAVPAFPTRSEVWLELLEPRS